MGKLPASPFEVRLAATLFLLLLGVANFFGAWQVKNFSSFSPAGVAEALGPAEPHAMPGHRMPGGAMAGCCTADGAGESAAGGKQEGGAKGVARGTETEIDLATLDRPRHHIDGELLVQDTHIHVPVYALTAAALSLLVFGLALPSRGRSVLVGLAFAAPAADFVGLWGAHLFPRAGKVFGLLAVAGGFAMGLAYLVVLTVTLAQCWFARSPRPPAGQEEVPSDASSQSARQ